MESPTRTTRILMASRYPFVRGILSSYLNGRNDIEVVVEAGDIVHTAAISRAVHPDVVLLDGLCPELHSDEFIARLDETLLGAVVLLTMSCVLSEELESLMERVPRTWGQVSLCEPAEALVDAVHKVASGQPRSPHPGERGLCPIEEATRKAGLSETERRVLSLVALGNSSKSIAARLRLSVRTVENHRFRLMKKLGVGSAAEMVRYAVRSGLINP